MSGRARLPLALLGAALLCRLWFSYSFPITLDEAWSWIVGRLPLSELLARAAEDISPPFTFLLHKVFTLGRSELGVRWPFMLAGFCSLFYLRAFSGGGALGLAFFSVSAFLVIEGSIARMHAFSLLFGSAAAYYFARTFERKKASDSILLALACSLGVLNFYPFAALPAAFALVFLLLRKESASPALNYALALGSAVPAFAWSLKLVSGEGFGVYAAAGGLELPSGAILAYLPYAFAYSEELLRFNELRGPRLAVFLLLLAPVAAVLLRGLLLRERDVRLRISLLAGAVSLAAVLAVSIKVPKVLYSAKYVIWAYPLFSYVFLRGLEASSQRLRAGLFAVIAAVNLFALYHAAELNREDWRATARHVEAAETAGDVVLFDSGHMRYPFSFYYGGKAELIGVPYGKPCADSLKPGLAGRVWLVEAHNWGARGICREKLADRARAALERDLGEIRVTLFESQAAPGSARPPLPISR